MTNIDYWTYLYLNKILENKDKTVQMGHNKKREEKRCFICDNIIEGQVITYMPYNDNLCDNYCLVKYRKHKNITNE
tara:strand:- start:11594 stop:11821 length:228 start_codon:yes stop_codon:yes gene_type:complete